MQFTGIIQYIDTINVEEKKKINCTDLDTGQNITLFCSSRIKLKKGHVYLIWGKLYGKYKIITNINHINSPKYFKTNNIEEINKIEKDL